MSLHATIHHDGGARLVARPAGHPDLTFYLGTHQPGWLRHLDVPLFISHRRLSGYKALPLARHAWALDSGAFSELSQYGRWTLPPADYVAGHLHGVWLDATLDADELHAAVQFMLRNGYVASAEEFAIMDYSDFCGADLGEYESLETVSRMAQGIAEYGEAFAKWAGYMGTTDMDEVERTFQDAFQGKFESTEAYVEHILSETGFNEALGEALEVIPDDLRGYISIEVEQLANDWEIELYIVEAEAGGVLVFDPRV